MSSSRRSRDNKANALNTSTGEDAALDSIARRAEELLQEKRKERERARRIRLQEIEKMQREEEEQMDRKYEMDKNSSRPQYSGSNSAPTAISSSRRSSVGSEDSDAPGKDVRLLYNALDEKYRRSMMTNAQLDNEKQALIYQVEEIKDRLEEIEEAKYCLDREMKDRHRQLEAEKRKVKTMDFEAGRLKQMVEQRDDLLKEHKLILMEAEHPKENGYGDEDDEFDHTPAIRAALISEDLAATLKSMDGTLEDKITHLLTENAKLKSDLRTAKENLEEERERASQRPQRKSSDAQINGGDTQSPQIIEMQRDSARQISEYKLKVQKAELDIVALEGAVSRLESQVKRYKQQADDSEKAEDELKSEKRKMQRELREAQTQIEELETQKSHLQNRLDRIRQARREVLGTTADA